MNTKITKGLAAIALAGVLSGGLAACGSSAGHAPAPKQSSTTAPAPAKADRGGDMAAWMAAGGVDDLNSIGRCISAMGDSPTRQQIGALSAAIATAQSRPMPSSVDPKGAYTAYLKHLRKMVTAYQSGDVATASSAADSINRDMKTLQGEMKAAGFDVSP